jgi:flagellar biosynthesis/type III secretory pathway protein FliH
MSSFADRFREEGLEKGLQQGIQQGMQQGLPKGMQQGEAHILLRLLHVKFGDVSEETRRRVEAADAETLLAWSERILTARSVDEVIH